MQPTDTVNLKTKLLIGERHRLQSYILLYLPTDSIFKVSTNNYLTKQEY